jgi:arylsulfatase A-like enzyme
MVLLLTACERQGVPAEGDEPVDTGPAEVDVLQLPDLAGQDLIILHLDTLRRDHLSAYGYERETFPLTAQRPWMIVHGARSSSAWTLPATASLMTGKDSYHHDMRYLADNGDPNSMLGDTILPELLSDAGYATGLFSGNRNASSLVGMGVGFDEEVLVGKAPGAGAINSSILADEALAWLATVPSDQALFLHFQPMDAHQPLVPDPTWLGTWSGEELVFPVDESASEYEQHAAVKEAWGNAADDDAREEITQSLRDVYDEALLGLDTSVDRVLEALDDAGRLDHALVVLLSDHGETIGDGDTGEFGHASSMREELVSIPLMFLHPDLDAGETECLLRNYDLMPTFLAAMGVAAPTDLDGIDLAGGCPGEAAASLWVTDGVLRGLSVATQNAKLARSCSDGVDGGTPLGAAYQVEERVDADLLPDGRQLAGALEAYARVVEGAVDDSACEASGT